MQCHSYVAEKDKRARTDEELIRLIQEDGDPGARAELCRRCQVLVENVIHELGKKYALGKEDLDDALQNAWVKVLESIAEYNSAKVRHAEGHPLLAFLRANVVNDFLNTVRNARRKNEHLNRSQDGVELLETRVSGGIGPQAVRTADSPTAPDPLRAAEQQDWSEWLVEFLKRSDERYPALLEKIMEHETQAAMAQEMELSVHQVKRLVDALRKELQTIGLALHDARARRTRQD